MCIRRKSALGRGRLEQWTRTANKRTLQQDFSSICSSSVVWRCWLQDSQLETKPQCFPSLPNLSNSPTSEKIIYLTQSVYLEHSLTAQRERETTLEEFILLLSPTLQSTLHIDFTLLSSELINCYQIWIPPTLQWHYKSSVCFIHEQITCHSLGDYNVFMCDCLCRERERERVMRMERERKQEQEGPGEREWTLSILGHHEWISTSGVIN